MNTTATFPNTSDITQLMRELGFEWSNQAQVYYDYNYNLINRSASERIYKKLLGANPYRPVGIADVKVHPNDSVFTPCNCPKKTYRTSHRRGCSGYQRVWRPCNCPKGGQSSDGRVCEKCDGSEWVKKANETWINSFISCHHKESDYCICESRKQELKRHLEKTREQAVKDERERIWKEAQEDQYEDGVMVIEMEFLKDIINSTNQ